MEVLYGVPPACIYLSINFNCSDKSMKLVSFNCTIEVNKDKDGYPNHLYVDVNADNVHLTQPYTTLNAETAAFITKLEHDFINHSIDFNRRIDKFNCDMKLEEYAPKVIKIEESVSKTTEESAVPQVARGGSEEIDDCPLSMEDAKNDEEMLKVMLASGLKEEPETRETGSDKA